MTVGVVESTFLPRLNVPTVRYLANGLTIIAEHVPVDAVNLSIWLNVGSAVETDNINGMAHFLEHMMFKGTKKLKSGEFEQRIEQRGAITNAATSQDYTHYYITTSPRDFADLAPLQFDVILNPAIPKDAFERERPVILEEIRRAQDHPGRRAFFKSMQVAFEHLPYHRPVLGTTDVIKSLTSQQMRDFHQHWYCPSAMTVVAVGNLPVDDLVEIAIDGCDRAGLFNKRPSASPSRPALPTYQTEPPFKQVIYREYDDDALTQARLTLMWRVPGMNNIEETYALDVLTSILGGGRTARLVKELREEKGLISGVSVNNMLYAHQGIFTISVFLPDEHISAVHQIILEHIAALHHTLVRSYELQRIQTQVANRYVFGNETPDNRAGLYGYYQTITGQLGPAIHYPNYIRGLTAQDLQKAAQMYLSPEAYGMVVIHPGSKTISTGFTTGFGSSNHQGGMKG